MTTLEKVHEWRSLRALLASLENKQHLPGVREGSSVIREFLRAVDQRDSKAAQ